MTVGAERPARFLMRGGAPTDGPRHISWIVLFSHQESIYQAKPDWSAGRVTAMSGGTEFIPPPQR
ncbi:pirin-like C-terminal cupin domain-containing protein [Chelatococcus albus]|uniref:pirin-like C-terminal cupin domain-containing protein n=1 Tax=Chelatococcus albus TaxID=3047466 RepID=UPI003BEEB3D8